MKALSVPLTPGRIFGLAFLLRLWFWMANPIHALVGDAAEYDAFARSLVETGRYLGPHGEAATRMPGYPLFLAAVRVLGGPLEVVLTLQCALSALTCVLLVSLARRVLAEPWALVCGVLAACFYDLIAAAAYPASECLYSFLLVLSVWALYREDWTPLRRALAFGALSGGLYLVRPEPLPYIVLTIASLPYLWAKFSRREVFAGLAVFGLVAGLWIGRNFAALGALVPASSVGQNVKYLSLLLPAERMGLVPEGRYEAPSALGELDREKDMARAYRSLAARMTPAQIVKAYAFNLASILYPFLPGYDWTYVFLVPFFLLGLREAVRRKELRPMAAAVLCSISIFIFFGGPASRYRQGVSPFIVLLAACGMNLAFDAWGSARFGRWTKAWLAFNVLVWGLQGPAREAALRLRAVLY